MFKYEIRIRPNLLVSTVEQTTSDKANSHFALDSIGHVLQVPTRAAIQALLDDFAIVSIIRKQSVLNSISYSSSTYGVNAIYQPNIPTRSLWQHYHHKANKIQFWRIKTFTAFQLKNSLLIKKEKCSKHFSARNFKMLAYSKRFRQC